MITVWEEEKRVRSMTDNLGKLNLLEICMNKWVLLNLEMALSESGSASFPPLRQHHSVNLLIFFSHCIVSVQHVMSYDVPVS